MKGRIYTWVFMVVAATSWAPWAQAQYEYAGEIFGGYSVLKASPGENADSVWLNPGWHVAATGWVNRWLGITADVTGHYDSISVPPNIAGISEVDIRQHGFLVGPRLRFLRNDRVTSSFRFVAGVVKGSVEGDSAIPDLTGAADASTFGFAFGGAVDLNLTAGIAWRIVQPNAYYTTFGESTQRNFRVSTGIVVRFGPQP